MSQDVEVHSIAFRPDGGVEITYAEARDQSPEIQMVKVMMIDAKHSGQQIEALLDNIQDVIELAFIRLRSDPETLPGMRA